MATSSNPRATHDWTADVRFFEYTQAANPKLPPIPIAALAASLHQEGPTRIATFDLAPRLGCPGPATTPNLLASFLRIRAGESLASAAVATSQLFYVINGAGRSSGAHGEVAWSQGDLFAIPLGGEIRHAASADAALYWVSDEPLLRYLGAAPTTARFRPTLYHRDRLLAELQRVRSDPEAAHRNRMGVLLGNAATPQTQTITHTLWSLLNVLPAGAVQRPHRHNSAALDLCIDAAPGTYTLIGEEIDAAGNIVDGVKAPWAPGAAFVTPPGWWHSHHNESGRDAMVLPIQDAGLYTFQRTLDIRFARG